METDTSRYLFNHSMIRVKDPAVSVKFYQAIGMKQINRMDFPESKFSLYFLAYDDGVGSISGGAHWTDRQGVVELTHNHGSEHDADFKVANGNSEPGRGFGHLCISVDNIQACCQRLEDAGYSFQKKLSDGRMRHIAFVLDPDGYWVEIVSLTDASKTAALTTTDPSTYRSNHTMLRVKDAEKSLAFYQSAMGMTLIRTFENADNKFNLYFLCYADSKSSSGNAASSPASTSSTSSSAHREGLLELTWNYGTETDAAFAYHDGNGAPQGFGHIAVSVDDLHKACARLEGLSDVRWKKRLTEGRMKDVAFVLDPDGYWIEIIQNERLKRSSNW